MSCLQTYMYFHSWKLNGTRHFSTLWFFLHIFLWLQLPEEENINIWMRFRVFFGEEIIDATRVTCCAQALDCWPISQVFWHDDCIISKNVCKRVCVRVSSWHCQSQWAGAITSPSQHLQWKDMLRTSWIKSVCGRECVGETALISAHQFSLAF